MTTTNTAETITNVVRWQARGFTEDVTVCDFCGRQELKGTVRMVALDEDGQDEGEQYAGVVCAARRAGTKAAVIREQATKADKARQAAYHAWHTARSDADYALSQRLLDERGLKRSFQTMSLIMDLAEYQAGRAAWDAANPAPERPARGW
jgi:Zn-dependent M32 family carboxypeptidase